MNAIQSGRVRSQLFKAVAASLMALALTACGGGSAGDAQPQLAWQGSWSAAPTGPASFTAVKSYEPLLTFENQTIRMIVRSSVGGKQVRIRLSNEIGDAPAAVNVGAVRIALRDKGSAIAAGSDKALTFGGKKTVTIPAKGAVYSDPVDLQVDALADLVVSIYLSEKTVVQSGHLVARQTSYLTAGDATQSVSLPAGVEIPSWLLLTGVEVAASKPAALVAFGDSITDGFGDSVNRVDGPTPWPSWPSRLGERMSGNAKLAGLSVLNAGISGNRLLSDAPDMGPAAVAELAAYGIKGVDRFDRDVLGQSGASCVVILEGINDIGIGPMEGKPTTAEKLIAGHKQLIDKAKAAGLRAIGATMTPVAGMQLYYSEDNEAMRQAVNLWIRTSGSYDGVLDFDAVVQDSAAPKQLLAQYDSGDHLHPSDAGYKAMADSIDLAMVERLCLKP